MLGADDLILLLTHHWARDTSIFPTEDQRLTLAAIMLLLIYTGCRPAELVDAAKRKATSRDPAYEMTTGIVDTPARMMFKIVILHTGR